MIYNYRLYNYDVWGNAKDGYDVNNVFNTGEVYELDDTWTDKQIISELKKQGAINKRAKNSLIRIDGEFEYSLYFEYKDKPEFELRKE